MFTQLIQIASMKATTIVFKLRSYRVTIPS